MKTIVYIDFNNTIEDIYFKRRGHKYFKAISRLAALCKEELEIYVITKANVKLEEDLFDLLYFMPENQRKFYKGLIKKGGETLTFIKQNEDGRLELETPIYLGGESKLDGVELSRKIIDKNSSANLYLFIGDDKDADMPMIEACVKCKKYMILANNRRFVPQIKHVIKTSKHSYGVAAAINKVCDEIERERQETKEQESE